MSDFVKSDQVLLDVDCATKEDVLALLSKKAVELGISDDEAAVRAAFDAREEEGSTGMMDGFAVPHAKTDAIKHASVIVLRFTGAVGNWIGLDDSDITAAIALLVPAAEAGSTHIGLLAKIARALMDDEFRSAVRAATEPQHVADLINARLD